MVESGARLRNTGVGMRERRFIDTAGNVYVKQDWAYCTALMQCTLSIAQVNGRRRTLQYYCPIACLHLSPDRCKKNNTYGRTMQCIRTQQYVATSPGHKVRAAGASRGSIWAYHAHTHKCKSQLSGMYGRAHGEAVRTCATRESENLNNNPALPG